MIWESGGGSFWEEDDDDDDEEEEDGSNGIPKRLRSSRNKPEAAAVVASTVNPSRSSRDTSPTE